MECLCRASKLYDGEFHFGARRLRGTACMIIFNGNEIEATETTYKFHLYT